MRAWPGGTGEYKIGANYGPTILPQRLAMARDCQQFFGYSALSTKSPKWFNELFVLLRDSRGKLELVTPPLDNGTILPGVTRASI